MDMVFRALAIYLFLVILLKVAGRRALLQMTSFDLILLLIISEATQQALLGEDFSITGAMITITTLVVVDIIFGLLKKYFSTVENILDGTPVILVENGVPLADKLKKVDVSCDDILVSARQKHGIPELKQIKYAILESNGHISIIPDEN
ncbi:YetF domain-containing protein [Enterobacter hormaechei]